MGRGLSCFSFPSVSAWFLKQSGLGKFKLSSQQRTFCPRHNRLGCSLEQGQQCDVSHRHCQPTAPRLKAEAVRGHWWAVPCKGGLAARLGFLPLGAQLWLLLPRDPGGGWDLSLGNVTTAGRSPRNRMSTCAVARAEFAIAVAVRVIRRQQQYPTRRCHRQNGGDRVQLLTLRPTPSFPLCFWI